MIYNVTIITIMDHLISNDPLFDIKFFLVKIIIKIFLYLKY